MVSAEVDPRLAIAQPWSDAELLTLDHQVQAYFQQPPPEPNWQAGEQLSAAYDRLAHQTQSQAQILLQHREELERLGVRRSWHYPFGNASSRDCRCYKPGNYRLLPKQGNERSKKFSLTQARGGN